MSKKIGSIILILFVLTISILGYRYIDYRVENAVSDAAFIKSDELPILSFKVSGKVVDMRVKEGQSVKMGELLAIIDDRDFIVARDGLKYQKLSLDRELQALKLKRDRINQTLKLQSDISNISILALKSKRLALNYKIDASQKELAKLQKDRDRYANMFANDLIARSDYEKIDTKTEATKDSIKSMQEELKAINKSIEKGKLAHRLSITNQKQIREIDKSIQALKDRVKSIQKSIDSLNLKISYTRLYSPIDGVVAKKFFDAPKVISSGLPVYAIADPNRLYCEVLLSEKKLEGVKVGNPVVIDVDALKGREYLGVVESISPVSASTFSLVPRDIASGEFTKLAQRFKIRIKLQNTKGLRGGMGARVAIKRVED